MVEDLGARGDVEIVLVGEVKKHGVASRPGRVLRERRGPPVRLRRARLAYGEVYRGFGPAS
jgi:hypothetical protein